jgi:hypothetical protein
VKSEVQQMKQCCIQYIEKNIQKILLLELIPYTEGRDTTHLKIWLDETSFKYLTYPALNPNFVIFDGVKYTVDGN